MKLFFHPSVESAVYKLVKNFLGSFFVRCYPMGLDGERPGE